MNTQTKLQPTTKVLCAFCGGSGRDPFGLLSPLSTCGVCGGSGYCTLALPVTSCAFCRGSGVNPHLRLNCTSCGGAGVAHVSPDAETCPACKGSGCAADYRWPDSPLSCGVCRGVGKVSQAQKRLFTGVKPTPSESTPG